ncbi:GNAT family N-acetyltransferase [Brevibacillus brevis]|uniref:GNAT family N-acetyltransferase n=1 Tax=Brevibacillus brevis TaxID=1393 RepID=A0A517IBA7_BREBE|nr:GNAT family N-acetyltransferase [Brevibacillus brevis]QDS36153.1 GNAT family N-acetyltransferase [Brevibacillus brevis]
MNIRRAKGHEASELSDLAYRSKAYWGYSDEFMEACRDDLTLSPAHIEEHEVYVLEDEGIKGFMSLEKDAEQEQWLLGFLFMEPEAVGKGYGKALWQHMVEVAQKLDIPVINIHSDPYAEPFYLSRGAKRVGEIVSTVFPGRKLPLLEVEIGKVRSLE